MNSKKYKDSEVYSEDNDSFSEFRPNDRKIYSIREAQYIPWCYRMELQTIYGQKYKVEFGESMKCSCEAFATGE